MDPVANLRQQLTRANRIIELVDESQGQHWEDTPVEALMAIAAEGEQLAGLVLGLDEWRRKGGFDPYSPADFSAPMAALLAACAAHPTQRLLQVIGNVFPGDSFYVEDDEAGERLREYAALGQRTVNQRREQ